MNGRRLGLAVLEITKPWGVAVAVCLLVLKNGGGYTATPGNVICIERFCRTRDFVLMLNLLVNVTVALRLHRCGSSLCCMAVSCVAISCHEDVVGDIEYRARVLN